MIITSQEKKQETVDWLVSQKVDPAWICFCSLHLEDLTEAGEDFHSFLYSVCWEGKPFGFVPPAKTIDYEAYAMDYYIVGHMDKEVEIVVWVEKISI